MKNQLRKFNLQFMERLAQCAMLDENTGNIKFNGMYAAVHFYFKWTDGAFAVPFSHVVWFLKYKRWPRDGYQLDHINDDPMDNRPINLQEMTKEDNQAKRRGRLVYSSYGKGKYGYGFGLHHDKRDNRYYLGRNLSRGMYKEYTTKTGKRNLGVFNTREEAEAKISEYIECIKKFGLDWMPPEHIKRPSYKTLHKIEQEERIRKMRQQGMTLHTISQEVGLSESSICGMTQDIDVDKRREKKGSANSSAKLNAEQCTEICKLRAEGMLMKDICERYKISRGLLYAVLEGRHWSQRN